MPSKTFKETVALYERWKASGQATDLAAANLALDPLFTEIERCTSLDSGTLATLRILATHGLWQLTDDAPFEGDDGRDEEAR